MPLKSSLARPPGWDGGPIDPRPPEPDGTPYLTLRTQIGEYAYGFDSRAARLRILAINPSGCDPAVFLYKIQPPNAHTGDVEAVYSGVCGSVELADHQAGQPPGPAPAGLFRLDWFEIDLPNRPIAEAVLKETRKAVARLLRAQVALARLDAGEGDVVVGPAPDPYPVYP